MGCAPPLAHAEPLAALFAPTVNSFKRINAAPTVSGATRSSNAISYGGNNRTHMVRIPEPGRFELRLMDGAANPYLLRAGLLAGGLDGIEHQRDPSRRLDIDIYEPAAAPAGIPRLPLNLLDACAPSPARRYSASRWVRRLSTPTSNFAWPGGTTTPAT
jgi:glutamate---methylamine ligase